MKPTNCPFPDCGAELEPITGRTFYCPKCKVLMQITIESASLDSPVLEDVAD